MELSKRALIHAENMQSEGWYTTANVLAECAAFIDAAEALKAAIQANVGHIEKASKTATANSPLQIEIACSKLLEAVQNLDRSKRVYCWCGNIAVHGEKVCPLHESDLSGKS